MSIHVYIYRERERLRVNRVPVPHFLALSPRFESLALPHPRIRSPETAPATLLGFSFGGFSVKGKGSGVTYSLHCSSFFWLTKISIIGS